MKKNRIYEGSALHDSKSKLDQEAAEKRETAAAKKLDKERDKAQAHLQAKLAASSDAEKKKFEDDRKTAENRRVQDGDHCQGCQIKWKETMRDWIVCDMCRTYSLCSKCRKEPLKVARLEKHELMCDNYGLIPKTYISQESDDESDGDEDDDDDE